MGNLQSVPQVESLDGAVNRSVSKPLADTDLMERPIVGGAQSQRGKRGKKNRRGGGTFGAQGDRDALERVTRVGSLARNA